MHLARIEFTVDSQIWPFREVIDAGKGVRYITYRFFVFHLEFVWYY